MLLFISNVSIESVIIMKRMGMKWVFIRVCLKWMFGKEFISCSMMGLNVMFLWYSIKKNEVNIMKVFVLGCSRIMIIGIIIMVRVINIVFIDCCFRLMELM